jgi:hypothetical protein
MMFVGIGSKFHWSQDNQVRTAARAWAQEASHNLSIDMNWAIATRFRYLCEYLLVWCCATRLELED